MVVAGICVIILAMIVGPQFSSPEFSWLRHSTSEQASQHMPGAWIMRIGFIAYGSSVFCAALVDWRRRVLVRAAIALFGTGLIGTAIWSNAPIIEGVPVDMHEDQAHSVLSGVVGFAFASACAFRLAQKGQRADLLAWSGLLIAILVPLAMASIADIRGLLQRGMFAFSFAFMLREFKDA